MKEFLKLTLVLTIICIIAGSLLAKVYQVTKDPIEAARKKEKIEALQKVVPGCEIDPDADKLEVDVGDKKLALYVGRIDGKLSGVACESSSRQGYGGEIRIMVGVSADMKVSGVEILTQTETPGLGAKIEDESFRVQYKDKSAVDLGWCKVRKDDPENGTIDALTGATISSRAVSEAVHLALQAVTDNKDRLSGAGESK